jgi:uncharacterized membrane protein
VPNWLYLFFNALYHLGLGLWIGGTIVLGALVAPALFKALPRHDAGSIFGGILLRFARLRAAALIMIIVSAAAKVLIWERNDMAPWLAVRWAAIVLLAWALVVDIRRTGKMMQWHSGIGPDVADDDPRRLYFNLLHVRAEGLMKASIVAAFFALLFS